eukprot:4684751-Amphidinium_carterae.1
MDALAWFARALPWMLPNATQQRNAEPILEGGACKCTNAVALSHTSVAPNTQVWVFWKYASVLWDKCCYMCSLPNMLLSKGQLGTRVRYGQYEWAYSYYYGGDYSGHLCGVHVSGSQGPDLNFVRVCSLLCLWGFAFVVTLRVLNCGNARMGGVLSARRIAPWLKQIMCAIKSDVCAVVRACVRCMCEIMLVMNNRMWICRRPVRRCILKLRDIAGATGEPGSEDEVLVHEETEEGWIYQPLANIQRTNPLVTSASPARWGGGRRWNKCRVKMFRVRHNPRTEGECLFACASYILQAQGKGSVSVKCLRRMVYRELKTIHEQGSLISGMSLSHWAEQLHMSAEELIDRTVGTRQHRRWGNMLDLQIIAMVCGLAVKCVDMITGDTLTCHAVVGHNMWMVGFMHAHFMVLKKCKRSHGLERQDCCAIKQGAGKRKCEDANRNAVTVPEREVCMSRVQTFARAVKIVKKMNTSVQQMVWDIEEELMEAVNSDQGFEEALGLELQVADCFLDPAWCVCETRLHFMRGVFLDLIILALKYDVSVCVRDEESNMRLYVGDREEIVLGVNTQTCAFHIEDIFDSEGRQALSDGRVGMCEPHRITWSYEVHGKVAGYLTYSYGESSKGLQSDESSELTMSPTVPWMSDNDAFVESVKEGAGWKWSSLMRSIAKRHRDSDSKTVVLKAQRGTPIEVRYTGSIAASTLVAQYAREKRVGKDFIKLRFEKDGVMKEVGFYDIDDDEVRCWDGVKITMINKRRELMADGGEHLVPLGIAAEENHERLWEAMNRAFKGEPFEEKDRATSELLFARQMYEESRQQLEGDIEKTKSHGPDRKTSMGPPPLPTQRASASSTDVWHDGKRKRSGGVAKNNAKEQDEDMAPQKNKK